METTIFMTNQEIFFEPQTTSTFLYDGLRLKTSVFHEHPE